jgi:oxygen-independent coproporphyrinogen-3 oxidase
MLLAMQQELKERKSYFGTETVETIYFGGGTPSLLNKEEFKKFIELTYENFNIHENVEISIEANPDDCTEQNLNDWKSIGVNRLSIGIQSFKESDLVWMNRAHNANEAKSCVLRAQAAGFDNLTIDLMYGLPGLTQEEWQNHIQTVVNWGVPHISSYCLTVEENTLLEKRVNSGELKVANDEDQSLQFEILVETLEKNGIEQYEISNFSKPGFESKHNSNYWKGVPYLGIGPSAHSFRGIERQWNVSNNTKYMKVLEQGEIYWESEQLTSVDQFNELLLTGLRTVYGVSLNQLGKLHEVDASFDGKLEDYKSNGWLTQEGDSIRLTKHGRLRADFIASELFIS